jgi:malonate transporter
MVALKLPLQPLAVWLLATLVFDVPPLWANVVILLAALPVGVNVYVFATRYDAGQAESAAAIVISSILSVVTLPLLLYWLGVG